MLERNAFVKVMVMWDGEVFRNVKRPTYSDLHMANLVIMQRPDGTLAHWKDRYFRPSVDDLTEETAEELVRWHVYGATRR